MLIVSLMDAERARAGKNPRYLRYAKRFDAEVAVLTENGARVDTVAADRAANAVMGINLMNPATAPAAALEGLRQGAEVADRVRAFWG